jgi:hypothetical protein
VGRGFTPAAWRAARRCALRRVFFSLGGSLSGGDSAQVSRSRRALPITEFFEHPIRLATAAAVSPSSTNRANSCSCFDVQSITTSPLFEHRFAEIVIVAGASTAPTLEAK